MLVKIHVSFASGSKISLTYHRETITYLFHTTVLPFIPISLHIPFLRPHFAVQISQWLFHFFGIEDNPVSMSLSCRRCVLLDGFLHSQENPLGQMILGRNRHDISQGYSMLRDCEVHRLAACLVYTLKSTRAATTIVDLERQTSLWSSRIAQEHGGGKIGAASFKG